MIYGNEPLWDDVASALNNQQEEAKSLEKVDRQLAVHPEDVEAWSKKGYILAKLQRYDEARNVFLHALSLDSDDPQLWVRYGIVLDALHYYVDEACAAYDRATSLNPENALAWVNKSSTLLSVKSYAAALEAADHATVLASNRPTGWNNKGVALLGLNRSQAGLKALHKAVALDSSYLTAWCNLGQAYRNLRHYEDALAAFTHVQTHDLESSPSVVWDSRSKCFSHAV